MGFDYAAVTRGETILCQCATASGNFDVTVMDIIKKLNPGDSRFQCERQNLRYFLLHDDNGLNFIIVGQIDAQAGGAFDILQDIKRRFTVQFGRQWPTAPAFGMQQEFSPQLESILKSQTDQKIEQIKSNLAESQSLMTDNLQRAIARGNTLNEMEEQASSVKSSAQEFGRQASALKRSMCWDKWKWRIFIGILAVVILYFIIACFCGFNFSKC